MAVKRNEKRDENGLTARQRRRLDNALCTLADLGSAVARQIVPNGDSIVADVCAALRKLTERR